MGYYSPHTEDEIRQMLSAIGLSSLEELFRAIPDKFRLKAGLNLPEGKPEPEVEQEIKSLSEQNLPCGRVKCFAGGGVYHHYVPRVVEYLASRSEFSTAYTPYQPEASQGTLQAIFEFQTMVCELTGMEVANASMYDGGEACAEAVLMALRVAGKEGGKILLSSALHPHYQRIIRTYTAHLDHPIELIPVSASGELDLEKLKSQEGICLVVQHPNYFGVLEQMPEIQKICQEKELILIVVVCEGLSLAILEPPGSFGAGIVCGEAQSFGIRPSFGGPLLGFFASKMDWVRRMPGRLVGETTDREGRRGYVLTLATREQHIRRAKATSNICTNHSLMALQAVIYLSLLGKNGLEKLAKANLERGWYLRKKIEASSELGLKFSGANFNELVVELGVSGEEATRELIKDGILAGVPLTHHFPELENCLLVAVTELVDKSDIELLVKKLEEISRRRK